MPLRQTNERPLVFTGPPKGEREFSAADPSASVRLLSVSQIPLRRACDLVPFAATVALHRA